MLLAMTLDFFYNLNSMLIAENAADGKIFNALVFYVKNLATV